MSLRARLLLAFAIVFVPVALLAVGLRRDLADRLTNEHQERLEAEVTVIEEDLRLEGEGIAARLESLARAIPDDDRFRSAVGGAPSDRAYLLDYAGTAMALAGLSMLQIQDDDGRIISSGHFRNEHGRVDALLAKPLAGAPRRVALIEARTPSGRMLVLARAASFAVGERTFTLVGGTAVNADFLARLVRASATDIALIYAGGRLSSRGVQGGDASAFTKDDHVERLRIPLFMSGSGTTPETVPATIEVRQSLTQQTQRLREADTWFVAAATGIGAAALLLAFWISARISRPLAALADKTAVLDLDRLDVEFDDGADEVGRLSRVLGDLVERLRGSTARVREAERRATTGDLARQINHDIKNGLVPLRNVMRHLVQVARDDPGALSSVLDERRHTLDSSIAYLETLANNYERLSPAAHRRDCDLNALVLEVVRGLRGHSSADLRVQLAPDLPRVIGDPVACRRILENLVTNAMDSLSGAQGRVTITTELAATEDEPVIRIVVADTGRGMSPDEQARIFQDFYTTKPGGTGLGLSIVRRLVIDLHGTLRVNSEVGSGTRMTVEVPIASRPLPN